jgi:hypothetical protein
MRAIAAIVGKARLGVAPLAESSGLRLRLLAGLVKALGSIVCIQSNSPMEASAGQDATARAALRSPHLTGSMLLSVCMPANPGEEPTQ